MDEIAMSNRAVVEAVDELMRRLSGIDRPMGGKVVVALGDFPHVGPVGKHGGTSATVAASIKSSYLWDSFEVLHLFELIRNADDPEYADFVHAIGADASGARIELNPFLAHSPSLSEESTTSTRAKSYLTPSSASTGPGSARTMSSSTRSTRQFWID